jgi:hypothetical protein
VAGVTVWPVAREWRHCVKRRDSVRKRQRGKDERAKERQHISGCSGFTGGGAPRGGDAPFSTIRAG